MLWRLHVEHVAGRGALVGTGGGGSFWDPSLLGSALRAWYKMDALTGANGDPIGAITDASANGFNLSQTATLRATLAAADLNSLNTLRFTQANTQRYALSNSIMSGLSAGSLYAVQKVITTSVAQGAYGDFGAGGTEYYPYSDGNIYSGFGATARKTVGTPTATLTAYRIFSIYTATNDWALYVDGGTGGSGGGTSPLFSTATNTVGFPSGAWLGANSALNGLDGWIAEIYFTNAKQSTTDRQKSEGYLAYKWGLQGNLAATHPYKSTRPPP